MNERCLGCHLSFTSTAISLNTLGCCCTAMYLRPSCSMRSFTVTTKQLLRFNSFPHSHGAFCLQSSSSPMILSVLFIDVKVHACIHTHIHTYTNIHTYIHTYITLHYITFHYIVLHYITLDYITCLGAQQKFIDL